MTLVSKIKAICIDSNYGCIMVFIKLWFDNAVNIFNQRLTVR